MATSAPHTQCEAAYMHARGCFSTKAHTQATINTSSSPLQRKTPALKCACGFHGLVIIQVAAVGVYGAKLVSLHCLSMHRICSRVTLEKDMAKRQRSLKLPLRKL